MRESKFPEFPQCVIFPHCSCGFLWKIRETNWFLTLWIVFTKYFSIIEGKILAFPHCVSMKIISRNYTNFQSWQHWLWGSSATWCRRRCPRFYSKKRLLLLLWEVVEVDSLLLTSALCLMPHSSLWGWRSNNHRQENAPMMRGEWRLDITDPFFQERFFPQKD